MKHLTVVLMLFTSSIVYSQCDIKTEYLDKYSSAAKSDITQYTYEEDLLIYTVHISDLGSKRRQKMAINTLGLPNGINSLGQVLVDSLCNTRVIYKDLLYLGFTRCKVTVVLPTTTYTSNIFKL